MVCVIIQARMSSTRLPGKVLLDINGRPMLSYMIERVKASKRINKIIIATSTDSSDDKIEEFCNSESILCYRGNLLDVLDRYYEAALKVSCDVFVRLTADCPLIDPNIIDNVVYAFENGKYDYVANTCPPTGTFPDGMDVEVFSFRALEKAWKESIKPSEREHVTFYFWKNPDIFSTFRYDLNEDMSKYRLTVDYPKDFEVIKAIINDLYTKNPAFCMTDIINYMEENKNIVEINSEIEGNQGWKSAFENDKKAGF